MSRTNFTSSNELRIQFTGALSVMYKVEVPKYVSLCSLVDAVNAKELNKKQHKEKQTEGLDCERHGAIRLGSANELSIMRRLFAVMGMHPVDYYDLSIAGIPVHSTAFRPIDLSSLQKNSFRVFTSLLRLDLIEDEELSQVAEALITKRSIFSSQLIMLIKSFEKQGGLTERQSKAFVNEALEVFRWHQDAQADSKIYQLLKTAHPLIADIVSFKGPHINHLTRHCLNIDELQKQLSDKYKNRFHAKKSIEGPPQRQCPILLRQTSFLALEEKITFSDGKEGTHTARFGEVEQRGVALTPKGRMLYDEMLRKDNQSKAFSEFPDNHRELHDLELAYYQYSVASNTVQTKELDLQQLLDQHILKITPILYEDFLPVSAAGIFASNLMLGDKKESTVKQSPNQSEFEQALGCAVISSFSLYDKIQKDSLKNL